MKRDAPRCEILEARLLLDGGSTVLSVGDHSPIQDEHLWRSGFVLPSPRDYDLQIMHNLSSAQTTRTDIISAGGNSGLDLTGQGFIVGVWDGAHVQLTHQEFGGRVLAIDTGANDGGHATHVAGTIGAAGIGNYWVGSVLVPGALRGMATQVGVWSFDYVDDFNPWLMDDLAELAANAPDLDVSNHSYGAARGWHTEPDNQEYWYGTALNDGEDIDFGKYDTRSHDLDQVLEQNPHLLSVWSAGNDRNDHYGDSDGDGIFMLWDDATHQWAETSGNQAPGPDGNGVSGYDTLANAQVAKNNLVVGAVNDGANMAVFSSWGPTDDGRIKPDVVGNGVAVLSADVDNQNPSNTFARSRNGTSFAAPNVTGTAVLLMEHYENLFNTRPLAATTKGLLIHTANDLGNFGPDYQFGWGWWTPRRLRIC